MKKKETTVPESNKCTFPNIEKFLKHICRETNLRGNSRYPFMLDYLQLSLFDPERRLPIIVLDSHKFQRAGKTLFISLLKLIFKNKMLVKQYYFLEKQARPGELEKVMIGVDDAFMATDYFTALIAASNGNRIRVEDKTGKPSVITNKLHFVFCTAQLHNLDDFDLQLYAPFSIYPARTSDPFLLNRMTKEVSKFVKFLSTREYVYFNPEYLFSFDPSVYQSSELPF